MNHQNNLIITLFILIGISTRIFPHPPNMTAIGAIALFGGAFFQDKRLAFLIPTLIMLISDLILGQQLVISVYVSFLIMVGLGINISHKQSFLRIFNTTLLASLIFFIITNFSVFISASLYPKTLLGLIECYTLAIPFFLNTLTGNMIYTFIMFYAFHFLQKNITIKING